jgi:hypothetical protein
LVVVRLREWIAARSLWSDEATLSMNLIGRDLVGLLGPLDFNQMHNRELSKVLRS